MNAAKEWLKKQADPDDIGSAEYRAIHELLSDALDGGLDEESLDLAAGILDELIGHAESLRNSLGRGY